jgi:uncharacterized protein YabN with tetrapyrrole methylase and pyrophosphatase domain
MINPHVYLMGAGIHFPEHLSMQTIEGLEACQTIFTNLQQQEVDNLPASLRSKTSSLWSLYISGRERTLNYADVVDVVIAGAETSGPVGWLTQGHPTIFDSVTSALLKACKQRDWRFAVLPAISSIDTLLADLGFEAAHGICILDATALVVKKIPLNSMISTVLLQPSALLNNTAQLTRETLSINLTPLAEHVMKFFPPTHKCTFVRSSTKTLPISNIVSCDIGQLDKVDQLDVAGSSLFIPGLAGDPDSRYG